MRVAKRRPAASARKQRKTRRARGNGAGYHGVGSTTGLSKSQLGPPLSYNMEVPYTEECLGAVTTPGAAFTNTTYIINPANSVTFPWLSGIAAKFEKYKFRKLHFKFVSTSADAVGSTNTALGSVLLNTNYDVLDSSFSTQVQMEDYGGAAEDKPAEHQVHVVDTAGRRGGDAGARFNLVSAATVAASQPYPTNSSAHDYDLGLFQTATVGQQAASTLGRLYVCYQVQLIRRKIDTPMGQSIAAGHWKGVPVTAASTFAAQTAQTGSNLPVTFAANTVTIGATGRYLVVLYINAATSVTANALWTASTNATLVASWEPSLATTATAGNTTAKYFAGVVVDIVNPGIITIGTPFTIVGAVTSDLYITQISSGMLYDRHSFSSSTHVLRDELQEMREAIAALQNSRMTCDSDFEDEEKSSDGRKSGPSTAPLSQSTLGLIGELIARKSSSK